MSARLITDISKGSNTMSSALDRVLNNDLLRDLAGFRAFRDGHTYFERDQVYGLEETGDTISAKVLGLYEYQVKLWAEGMALGHICSCPVGQGDDICKHGVAVALTWLSDRDTAKTADTILRELDPVKTITTYLATQDRSALMDIILEGVRQNTRLRNQMLFISTRTRAQEVEHNRFRQYTDLLLANDPTPAGYADSLHQVLDALAALIKDGYPKDAQRLTEYTLDRLEDLLSSLKADSDTAVLQSALDRLQDVYLKTCRSDRPDIGALAKRLLEWRLNPQWDMFPDALATYADVLGEHGFRMYRMLAEEAWENEPTLAPGDTPPERYGRRFRLAYIMETLARQANDFEGLLALRRKDLSQPASFLSLAGLYKEAGQDEQALSWAEQGIESFSGRPDPRLRDFLIAEYSARGWLEKVAALQKR